MQNHETCRFFLGFLNVLNGLLPIIFWIFLIYGFDDAAEAGLTVISAIIHECGHELFWLIKYDNFRVAKGHFFGFKIRKDSLMSYDDEAWLYASGALANLLVCIISVCFIGVFGEYAQAFAIINAITALTNVLPVRSYDGYGIIRAIATKHEQNKVISITDAFSLAFSAFMCIFSLYIMHRLNGGYWIFAIFIFSLVSELALRLKSTN